MNLLQLIQTTCAELGLDQPNAVIGATDKDTIQFYALLNRLGKDIIRQFEWQRLQKNTIITTVNVVANGTLVNGSAVITGTDATALSTKFSLTGVGIQPFAQILSVDSATQVTMNMPAVQDGTVELTYQQISYDLPSDWERQIPQTEWDRTNRWPLLGPVSPQDWQSFRSGIVYAGPRQQFRIANNYVNIEPNPPAGLLFAYEYISNAWVRSAAGVEQSSFLADTDTTVFDDSLLITGLKSQWKAAKGLDGSYDMAEFRSLLEAMKSQDHSAPMLSLSSNPISIFLTTNNIQDGNFPG
jgi:hypothetical protein